MESTSKCSPNEHLFFLAENSNAILGMNMDGFQNTIDQIHFENMKIARNSFCWLSFTR